MGADHWGAGLSFKAAAWAIDSDLPENGQQKLLLIVLADCHNTDNGRCDPSLQYLCTKTKMSRSTVIRCLARLIELGLIAREARFSSGMQTSNSYEIRMDSPAVDAVSHRHPPVSDRHPPVSHRHPGGVTQTPMGVSGGHPNQEMNLEVNREKNKKRATARAVLCPVGVDDQIWNDFVIHRKLLKAPITETALAGIEREADKAGLSLNDALRICCERSWRGFKADWVADEQKAKASKVDPFAELRKIADAEEAAKLNGRAAA